MEPAVCTSENIDNAAKVANLGFPDCVNDRPPGDFDFSFRGETEPYTDLFEFVPYFVVQKLWDGLRFDVLSYDRVTCPDLLMNLTSGFLRPVVHPKRSSPESTGRRRKCSHFALFDLWPSRNHIDRGIVFR